VEFAKKPKKGVARFCLPDGAEAESRQPVSDYHLDLAACLCKSCLSSPEPFANVWLNVLSGLAYAMAADGRLAEIGTDLNSFLGWASLTGVAGVGSELNDVQHGTLDVAPVQSSLLCGFAVAHGLLRFAMLDADTSLREQSLLLSFENDGVDAALNASEDGLLWCSGSPTEAAPVYDIGGACTLEEGAELLPGSASVAALVKIGHDCLEYPESLFAEILTVDDRPAKGGGLPDFWEATLARLVSHVLSRPDTSCIFAVGDPDAGREVLQRLQHVEDWVTDAEELAYRTGLSAADIQSAAERLKDNVHFPPSKEDLVGLLAEILRPSRQAKGPTPRSHRQLPFLKRRLAADGFSLLQHDGCRVRSIAEAYPVVLEICRQHEGDPILDQAGLQLRELIDFRVHLTQPLSDTVPAFYAKEQSSLDDYFRRVFADNDSLFGRRFRETGQLDAVLDHIVAIIRSDQGRFATRRAILVVPHEIQAGPDIAPLGLVSVRLLLRFAGSTVVIGFSFTWRTVEALVGFPYSLYGSVRFGDHLVQVVKSKLPDSRARNVRMGELSYVAHSLHMFADEHGQNIARRIVNDATF